MLSVLYPATRIGRVLITTHTIHHFTNSIESIVIAALCTDIVSIVADSRPFFNSWHQFILAALFLPWYFDSYWELFKEISDIDSYIIEFCCIIFVSLLL